ncbi:acyl-CoA dehydrogenase family protein [Streptomyces violaceorubidus]
MTTGTPWGAQALETAFGDPLDALNPTGLRAALDADERAEPFSAGERVLRSHGLAAELLPTEHGGRLSRADHLVEILRTIHRRDPALALARGALPLTAAAHTLAARPGSPLPAALAGGRQVVVVHEDGFDGCGVVAVPRDGGWLLSGGQDAVRGARHADLLLVHATPEHRPDERILFLVDPATAPLGALRVLPRPAGTGTRAVPVDAVELHGLPVTARELVGDSGTAAAARTLVRAVLPPAATGALDTGLRVAVAHLSDRTLYGGPAVDIPLVRTVLAGVFTDLLRAETLGAAAARCLHLAPGLAAGYADAAAYVVPGLVTGAMDRLAELLGAHFYLREGPTGAFQKLLRDLLPADGGQAGRTACRLSLLAALPALGAAEPVPEGVFAFREDVHGAVPALPASARGVLPVPSPRAALREPWTDGHEDIGAALSADAAELDDLIGACAALPAGRSSGDAPARHHDLVDRYVRLLERDCQVRVWRHTRDPFLADPAWLRAALHRGDGHTPMPAHVEQALLRELVGRQRAHRSFGIGAHRLPHAGGDLR